MAKNLMTFKGQLSKKTKEALIDELITLYKKVPEVKKYYNMMEAPVLDVLNNYKSIMKDEFSNSEKLFPKLRFSVANKALSDFKKISNDPKLILDLTLYYAECLAEFINAYGPKDEKFYDRAENLYEQALKQVVKHNFLAEFKPRLRALYANACDGYGFQDQLEAIYSDYFDEIEECE
ncbi:DUF6155 family protein [Facilibium subflavum]|uniref:DUF6155 family protein n=1 Tax=Facilibium subflavum TaxID=2219058 RepID=UPI000E648B6E|nr:DUF6155 family protein [Facilibium subflavum]